MAYKIISIVGARPQFVKAAAVSRAFAASPDCRELLVHTGQHFDANMSSVFFEELEIPEPAYHLDIHGGGHGQMTGRMLEELETVFLKERPDMVLVYGDTNSTLAGGLAAAKLHIPVSHVEAGLRSFNRKMPEEINRVLVDHISALLLCPTETAIANLAREGITRGVRHVGDVMYDATLRAREIALARSGILETLGLTDRGFAVCTIHRAENTDDPVQLRKVMDYLAEQAKAQPIIFPIHPRTRQALARENLSPMGVRMIDPLGYIDLNRLLASAAAVFTDSGGLQKEAYFHGVPCTTLRDETEWVETVDHGWNRLWNGGDYAGARSPITDYGPGDASEKIMAEVLSYLDASSGR